MGNKKIIFITVAIIVTFVCLGVIGVRSFVQAIYSERSCDWANIDNIEMHAHIDIPAISGCDCTFNTTDNIKTAVFSLDEDVDLLEFLGKQKLQKAIASADLNPSDFSMFRNYPTSTDALYVRSDNNYDSGYRLMLDTLQRKLWVSIRYKR